MTHKVPEQHELDALYKQGGAFIKTAREKTQITLEGLANTIKNELMEKGLIGISDLSDTDQEEFKESGHPSELATLILRELEAGNIPPDPVLLSSVGTALGINVKDVYTSFGYRKAEFTTKSGAKVDIYLSASITSEEEAAYAKAIEEIDEQEA